MCKSFKYNIPAATDKLHLLRNILHTNITESFTKYKKQVPVPNSLSLSLTDTIVKYCPAHYQSAGLVVIVYAFVVKSEIDKLFFFKILVYTHAIVTRLGDKFGFFGFLFQIHDKRF